MRLLGTDLPSAPGSGAAPSVLQVACDLRGPPQHGVVRYAHRFARALGDVERTAVAPLDEGTHAGRTVLVLHASDSLAVRGRDRWSGEVELQLRSWPGPRVVHLHDVPEQDDGADRVRPYGRLVRACDRVVVCSEVEAARVHHHWTTPVSVVAHVPERRALVDTAMHGVARRGGGAPTLAVLGHVYPGKRHHLVVDAAAALRRRGREVEVLCIGRAARGHEDLLRDLADRAARLGVGWHVTGWVEDRALPAWLDVVDVPVVANDGRGASGSLADWTGAGRAPVVVDTPYAREVRAGGTPMHLADADRLDAVVSAVLDEPSRTRFAPPTGVAVPADLLDLVRELRAGRHGVHPVHGRRGPGVAGSTSTTGHPRR